VALVVAPENFEGFCIAHYGFDSGGPNVDAYGDFGVCFHGEPGGD
jgi:hypothetical protein